MLDVSAARSGVGLRSLNVQWFESETPPLTAVRGREGWGGGWTSSCMSCKQFKKLKIKNISDIHDRVVIKSRRGLGFERLRVGISFLSISLNNNNTL